VFKQRIAAGVVVGLESGWTRKDGSVIFVRESARLIRDDAGHPLYFEGTVEDITERKLYENRMIRSETYYRTLVETSPDAILIVDAGAVISFASGKAFDLFGAPRTISIIGASIFEWIDPEDRDKLRSRLAEIVSERAAPDVREYRLLRYDRTPFWAEISSALLPAGPDGRKEILVVCRDVSERRKAEDEANRLTIELEERVRERTALLEAANKELESFAYSASHDLRAPLRGIDGWSLALLEDYGANLDKTGRLYLERVRSEAQRMGRLIDDLLRFSRETRRAINWQKVDISTLAATVSAQLRKTNPDRSLRFEIQPGLTAYGDPSLLRLVLDKLLDNAVKFSVRRSPALVEVGQDDRGGERVFFVRDNGAGFDMAYAGKLFRMFQRLHGSDEFPGTGVGLATVQRIITRHGGRIWAEAGIERGATFYFTLKEAA
jgi:PAS domain S-box-containing protein